jgi:hypothetical protein
VFWADGEVHGLNNDGHVSWALAISGTTMVGGERLLIGGILQGLIWLPDGTVEVLPGEATAIRQGMVAGYVFDGPHGEYGAWRWDATHGWMMLETPAGMQYCSAWGINGQGLTVGNCLPISEWAAARGCDRPAGKQGAPSVWECDVSPPAPLAVSASEL